MVVEAVWPKEAVLAVRVEPKRAVEVEFAAMKEPVLSIVKSEVPAAFLNFRKLPVKPVVEEAVIRVPVVPVAFT